MQLEFTGRQLEITPDVREYAEKRLHKLERVLRNRCEIKAILTAEKRRRIAELTLNFREHTLVGVSVTPDILTSINDAIDKLERQAVKLMGRKRERKRRPPAAQAVLVNVLKSRTNNDEQRVLETEHIAIKPLSIEEAIDALDDDTRRGIVVFRNTESERVNVIYKRHDGNLGLIEPEP